MEDYQYLEKSYHSLAGTDEVGRGPIAGPVVAASVLLSSTTLDSATHLLSQLEKLGVTDSKKLSSKKRVQILSQFKLFPHLLRAEEAIIISEDQQSRLSYSISVISESKIDEINILRASLLAMKSSYEVVRQRDYQIMGTLLVDGNKLVPELPQTVKQFPLIKGDSRSLLIALASIIAKEYRDHFMNVLDEEFPEYGFRDHAGYPTKKHLEALSLHGVTRVHRSSYGPVQKYLPKR